MKRFRFVSVSLSLMACLGMLIPPAALAELPVAKPQASKTMDVALHSEGLLVGQVVDPQGTAKEGVAVKLLYRGRELARTKTDKLGRFAVKGLKGGTYKLATAGTIVPVRAWTKFTAPPTVAVGALLVEGVTVRGQYPTFANPSTDSKTVAPNTTTYYVNEEGAAPPEPTVSDPAADAAANYGSESTATQSTGTYSNGSYYGGHAHHAGYPGASYGATGGGGLFGFGASPVLIGAGIAAAIAIPVALDDDDDDDAS